ncbi:hypothetical protein LEP1GSC060_1423 [Leptospira weilii serovar Ranarum str. ICFT]|uniref:Uncharacterized protein n=1 Tax=Leptospira weilii serovar Ranarum str. ICFT TaxID=1218598 RepID=N1WRB7_9LEPT|nr:hypothetical protein LEP1GSC060_1423 [Leptospira weilii serovar Ranarum str. ICFT]
MNSNSILTNSENKSVDFKNQNVIFNFLVETYSKLFTDFVLEREEFETILRPYIQ